MTVSRSFRVPGPVSNMGLDVGLEQQFLKHIKRFGNGTAVLGPILATTITNVGGPIKTENNRAVESKKRIGIASWPITDHYLSVNLEDYFQVAPLSAHVPRSYWERFSLRVERNTLDTLDLLDKSGARATFFVNGWIAERCPDLVAEVARRGHEVASKGFFHRPPDGMSIDQFRTDFRRARDAIEDAANCPITGYRVAHGGLPVDNIDWFRVLAEEGVRFDSSVRPFGLAFRNRQSWRTTRDVTFETWSLTEVPVIADAGRNPCPGHGGNYLRQVPASLYENRLQAS